MKHPSRILVSLLVPALLATACGDSGGGAKDDNNANGNDNINHNANSKM